MKTKVSNQTNSVNDIPELGMVIQSIAMVTSELLAPGIWMRLNSNRKWKSGDCSFRNLGSNYTGYRRFCVNAVTTRLFHSHAKHHFVRSFTEFSAVYGPVMKRGDISDPTDAAGASALKHKSTE